jgi:hypothetical protein
LLIVKYWARAGVLAAKRAKAMSSVPNRVV